MLESGLQRGELRVQRLQLGLVRLREPGAGAHEILVVTLEQPFRFRIQAALLAVVVERFDPREERTVEMDRIRVRGKLRRHFFLDFLQSGIGVGPGEIRKDPAGAIEELAHFLERDDRVLEGRLLRLLRDGFGFLLFLRDPLLQRRLEMLVLDLVEGRHLIGQSAFREERIAGRGGGHFIGRGW